MSLPSLLVFADDWGRHPSSCQHLITQMANRYSVTWVNTIGTRTPRLDRQTIRRGFGKIRQWIHPKVIEKDIELPAVHVLNPRMWPWFTRKIDRRINRKLLVAALRPYLAELSEPPIAITTLPIVADLMEDLAVNHWIYYCVDDFSQWPGLDRKTLGKMEREVLRQAEGVVAVSEPLLKRLANLGRDAELLTHGVDLEFWQIEPTDNPESHKPVVLFWGVIDARMDTQFLKRLANDLTEPTILLAGPEQNPDPELRRLPRTYHLGPVPYRDLPKMAQKATVLIMPYADLAVTRAMQPLKLKEYLATGLPVVVRDLPANRVWADCLDLVDSAEAFSRVVRLRIGTGLPESQRLARNRLRNESWATKADRFEQLICMNSPVRNGLQSWYPR